VSDLFPTATVRKYVDAVLTEALAGSRERVNQGSVMPSFDLGAFRDQLKDFDFAAPRPVGPTLKWAIAQMETGLVHVAHPRYFGLFNPTPNFPSQCADRIAAVFNPQLATATTSPAAVEIEAHVIRAVATRLGLPADATGHFTTGGAEANYTALVLALTRACPDFAADGARAFNGRPTLYISRESHLAWLKIAHQAGIGRAGVRLVDTDGMGRMDSIVLAAAIDDDLRQGHVPVMIVATAGTTNAGMVDPLDACSELAARLGLWLHVDAAWGGAIVASNDPAARSVLAGIEAADSVTVDAHKWFATTMGCGMFITRHAGLLGHAFHVQASYMPSNAAGDPYVTSMQWSRRFVGLRLFLALAVAGWQGYGEHIDRTLALGERLRLEIQSRGFRVANRSVLGVLCLDPPAPATARAVVQHVLATGQAWVSIAVFEGREIIRACVTSGDTTEADIEVLVASLEQAAAFLSHPTRELAEGATP